MKKTLTVLSFCTLTVGAWAAGDLSSVQPAQGGAVEECRMHQGAIDFDKMTIRPFTPSGGPCQKGAPTLVKLGSETARAAMLVCDTSKAMIRDEDRINCVFGGFVDGTKMGEMTLYNGRLKK